MTETEKFLSDQDEAAIIEAIVAAEKNTSGEIRVHLENHTDLPALKRAQQIFHELGMDNTEIRNGVLFYVGVSDHTFAIIGDQGIDQVVEPDFWDCTKDLVISHFKNRRFREGLVSGILRAGERLKQHFPRMHDDTNELSNDISKG